MSNIEQALKSLIEALEYHTEQTRPIQKTIEAIELGKSALSDIEKCDPVAWLRFYSYQNDMDYDEGFEIVDKYKARAFPVYTSPISKEWVGLSADDELHLKDAFEFHGNEFLSIRETEAKLKQLNAPDKG